MEMTAGFPFVQLQCLFQKSKFVVKGFEYSPSFLEKADVGQETGKMKTGNTWRTLAPYPRNNSFLESHKFKKQSVKIGCKESALVSITRSYILRGETCALFLILSSPRSASDRCLSIC